MFPLTSEQHKHQQEFRKFVNVAIFPNADAYDREEHTPRALIEELGQKGYLGALIPQNWHGSDMDMLTFGLLSEELGRGCSSVRSLLTVHSMVAYAILRWGSRLQKERWLSRMASGEVIGAFGLSEPHVGSDAKSVETAAEVRNDVFVLNGIKKWITYGQIADLFLTVAQCDGRVSAFLVPRNTPGLQVKPLSGMLGTRASMLAEVSFQDCQVGREALVGGHGFGLAAVAASALDIGRYSVACGCVGIAQACLDASLSYTTQRKQFGTPLKNHQLIQQMITDMATNILAARLLCYHAGSLKEKRGPDSILATWQAKYFASVIANKAAKDAVQMHGANGCSSEYSVQRYLRDAAVMEIIEGSSQIQQTTIAQYCYQDQVVPHENEGDTYGGTIQAPNHH